MWFAAAHFAVSAGRCSRYGRRTCLNGLPEGVPQPESLGWELAPNTVKHGTWGCKCFELEARSVRWSILDLIRSMFLLVRLGNGARGWIFEAQRNRRTSVTNSLTPLDRKNVDLRWIVNRDRHSFQAKQQNDDQNKEFRVANFQDYICSESAIFEQRRLSKMVSAVKRF